MNVKAPVRRKWRFARPQTPAWMDTLCAVLIAVAAHLLFFGVFNYDKPAGEGRKSDPHLTLCNISGMAEKEQKRALKWLSLHDPGLSVRGDSPVGFSSYLPQGKRRRITVEEFRPAMEIPAAPVLKYAPLGKRKIEEDSFPGVLPEREIAVDRVKVFDMRGKELALSLEMTDEYVSGSNVFAIRGKGDFRRVEVLKQLSPAQDQLAAKALLESDISGEERITVLWQRGEK